jgi:hypothetical protein
MRLIVGLLLIGLLVGCRKNNDPLKDKPHGGDEGHKHGGDEHAGHKALGSLELQTREGIKAGEPTMLRLTIPDAKGQPIKALAVFHDAKVHLIAIGCGLNCFAHLHPEVDPATGILTANHTFPADGVYHLFADYQEQGKQSMMATARVEVAGDAPAATKLKPDVPGLFTGEKIAARVSFEGAKPRAEAKVRFEVLEGDNPVTDLDPYMGAMGNLVIVSADAKQYVQAHPEAKADAKHVVTFGAAFPSAGTYKGCGQFKRGGQVRIMPFVVQIS